MVLRVHHVGVALRADLDLRDDLLDGAEADLRRGHLDRVLADGHGERHVRLGFVLEVDGAPVGLARLAPRGTLGAREKSSWLPTTSGSRRETRSCSLPARSRWLSSLTAGTLRRTLQEVELALLGQRRAQSLAKAEPALPHLARVGIVGDGPGRLAHLLLDLLQELLDPGGRGHRLGALDPDDRALGLPVGEVELDQARRHQHAADEDEQDDDVLAEEPPARRGGLIVGRRRRGAGSCAAR